MTSRDELIQVLTQSKKKMSQACELADLETEIYPGWTKKEILAHLIAWDVATRDALEAFRQGEPPVIVSDGTREDMDRYNDHFVNERADQTYYTVYKEWEYVRRELLDTIRKLSPGSLEEEMTFPWEKKGTPAELINGIASHERHHAHYIQDLIIGQIH
jgi:hypothetical protein